MFGRLFPAAANPHLRHGLLGGAAGRVYVLVRDDGRLVKLVHKGNVYLLRTCDDCGGRACRYCAACGREQRAGGRASGAGATRVEEADRPMAVNGPAGVIRRRG